MFGRLKDWRRVATRYDRCPKVFLSAIALAAALTGAFDCRGKTVLIVLSGGNVDPEQFVEALHAAPAGG